MDAVQPVGIEVAGEDEEGAGWEEEVDFLNFGGG